MNIHFPRLLTLLRKELGISQKNAAKDLEVSQALLSHYEKGIRECGLDFVTKCADYYNVSCDYLLGRSPQRNGSQIKIEDIPESDTLSKDKFGKSGLMPTLNRKLISNSLNILFDLLSRSGSKTLTSEVSAFLMISVYRMFRVVHGASSKNHQGMFIIPRSISTLYADAAMQLCEANANALAIGQPVRAKEKIPNPSALTMTTEKLSVEYPLYASSLFNLIQNSENKIPLKK